MAKPVGDNTKSKRPDQTGTLVGVRFQPDQLAELDAFIASYSRSLTRPEAVRLVAHAGLLILNAPEDAKTMAHLLKKHVESPTPPIAGAGVQIGPTPSPAGSRLKKR